MDKEEFMHWVMTNRNDVSCAAFITGLRTTEMFPKLVKKILENNQDWATKVGKIKKKLEKATEPSEVEILWKNFFSRNSFDNSNQQRLFAEAFSIVTNMDLLRFLKLDKDTPGDYFPPFVCLVPIANRNEHNYKLGDPILNTVTGTSFYRLSGTKGNSMDREIDSYRMAELPEIEICLGTLLYRNDGMIIAINPLYKGLT